MIRLLVLFALLSVTPALGQQTVVTTCGTANYTAGTTSNQTQDLNGQTCT